MGIDPRTFTLSYISSLLFVLILGEELPVSLSHPGWAQTFDPPASTSLRAAITGVHQTAGDLSSKSHDKFILDLEMTLNPMTRVLIETEKEAT